jgi:hypothetical protein
MVARGHTIFAVRNILLMVGQCQGNRLLLRKFRLIAGLKPISAIGDVAAVIREGHSG